MVFPDPCTGQAPQKRGQLGEVDLAIPVRVVASEGLVMKSP